MSGAVQGLMMSYPAAAASYRSTVLADSPTAYWRLGESSGITAADEQATYNGTYSPNSAGSWTGGTLAQTGIPGAGGNTAALFNATTGYITCGTSASLGFTTAMTIEAWVKYTNSDGTSDPIATKWLNAGSNFNFYFGRVGTKISMYVGGGFQHADMNQPNDGAWHHVVGVIYTSPSKNIEVYLDGAIVGSPVSWSTTGGTGGDFRIGGNADASSELWTGTIDEVAVYPTNLSAAQILNHYNVGH